MQNLFTAILFIIVAHTIHAQPGGVNTGDQAPLFTAKDQYGNSVSLAKTIEKGPVVLIFYRGAWCPYCNRQLKKLEDSLRLITAKGAVLLAVTPEKPENVLKTVSKTKASYSILYDEGLNIMKAYDVSFAVDSNTIETYKKYGIDFTAANGTNGANLPVPAVYIINKEGRITWKYFDMDYRKRASVQDILEHL